MGKVVEPCFVDLGPDSSPFRQAEVADLALDCELVLGPRCGIPGAGIAVERLRALGDEVLAELERAVEEVHVREAPRCEQRD